MDISSDDNESVGDEPRRRDSFGGLQKELGQGLPDASRRPKCNDPAVAVAVLDSEQKHLDAVFDSHDVRAADNALAATKTTIRSLDWSEWFGGGEETLGFRDPAPTKKRPTAKTPPPTGPQDRDSGRRATRRPYGKSPPKVSED